MQAPHRSKLFKIVLRQLRRLLLTTLLIGFAGATLVRLGPGFGVDERALDTRLNEQSIQAIHAENRAERNIVTFYLDYLGRLLHGDLGFSRSLNRPVSELMIQRLPLTLASLLYGVAGGLSLGFLFAAAATLGNSGNIVGSALAALCVSLPSALIALCFLWWGAGGRWAIALVIFPHVYRYARNLLATTYSSDHVLVAMAKGLGRTRIFFAHVVGPVLPQLAALAGISVTMAFAASIPIEAVCDIPGVGQLAWKAALSRDLPLLVGITMLAGLITLVANGLAGLALEARPVPGRSR